MCGNGYGACLMKEAGLVQQLAAAVRTLSVTLSLTLTLTLALILTLTLPT